MSQTVPSAGASEKGLLDMSEAERGNILRAKRRRQKTANRDLPTTEPTPKPDTPSAEVPPSSEAPQPELRDEAEEVPAAKRQRTEPSSEPHTEPSSEPQSPGHDSPPHMSTPTTPHIRGASTSGTLWPDDEGNFPINIFENFILPGDDRIFQGLDRRELANYNALYLSRAAAAMGRLLRQLDQTEEKERRQEAEIARLQSTLNAAMVGWENDKKLHANTNLHCEELQAEVAKLKEEAIEGEQRRRVLIDNYEALKKERNDLTADNQAIGRKLESVEIKLGMAEEAKASVEKEFADYKASVPLLTEEAKQQIRQEYRRSPELTDEVVQQFNLGYQSARDKDKEKMRSAALNGDLLDTSDEDEAEPASSD